VRFDILMVVYMSFTVLLKNSVNILEEPAACIMCIAGDGGFLRNTDIIVPHSTALSKKIAIFMLNLLTPNVNYSWRTAPLTSKVAFYICIQQI